MTELARDSGSRLGGLSPRNVLKLLSQGQVGAVLVLSLALLLPLAWSRAGLWPTLVLTPLIVALAAIVVLDLAARIIPNVITLPMLAYALLLAATHVTLPLLHAVLGAVIGAGVTLVGVGMLVALLNVLMRLGIESGADRDREEEARRYFDRHGRWPPSRR